MTKKGALLSLKNLRFSDEYEVYVDYGKGQPVKMDTHDKNFIDVEQFLSGKPIRTEANDEKCQTKPSKISSYRSIVSEDSHCRTSKLSQVERISVRRETWLSNKRDNPRVTASNYRTCDSSLNKHERACHKHVSQHASYPKRNSLCLNIAVNGLSKSSKGVVPRINSNLTQGNYGDDVGLFIENEDYSFIALADGASGNRSLGIDPIEYSQAILAACQRLFIENHFQFNQLTLFVLSAIENVEKSAVRGSSTLCSLVIDKQHKTLKSLNIGDSGFIIYRNDHIYHRSTCTASRNGCGPGQIHSLKDSFGYPCFINETEIKENCSLDTVQIQNGDIIIISSDGLWDVLDSKQLHHIIKHNRINNLQNIADDLLRHAINGYAANRRDDILIMVCRIDET